MTTWQPSSTSCPCGHPLEVVQADRTVHDFVCKGPAGHRWQHVIEGDWWQYIGQGDDRRAIPEPAE